MSHTLPSRQSRATVSAETSSATAVSSTLKPPKKRSSMTRAFLESSRESAFRQSSSRTSSAERSRATAKASSSGRGVPPGRLARPRRRSGHGRAGSCRCRSRCAGRGAGSQKRAVNGGSARFGSNGGIQVMIFTRSHPRDISGFQGRWSRALASPPGTGLREGGRLDLCAGQATAEADRCVLPGLRSIC